MPFGRAQFILAAIVAVVFMASLLYNALGDEPSSSAYPYSQLIEDASAGRVMEVLQQGLELTVVLTDRTEHQATVASDAVNVYAEVCSAAGEEFASCSIRYEAIPVSQTGSIVSLLITAILPVLLIGAFIYFMMRQQKKT
jgi:ATP-dependent Zn protease